MFATIITDYFSMSKTLGYIHSLLKNAIGQQIIIIVDNSMEHQGINFLTQTGINFSEVPWEDTEHLFKFSVNSQECFLVEAAQNKGYAGGNNLGARIAKSLSKAEFLLFSNNDLRFPEKIDFSIFAQQFSKHPKVGIIGPNIRGKNGSQQNPRKEMGFFSQMIAWDVNIMLLRGIFNRWVWNLDQRASDSKITGWVSGSFMVVRQDIFNLVGGFDETPFLYAEEMILSERFRKNGYQTYYYEPIKIIHAHQGANPSKRQRLWNHDSKRYYYQHYKYVNPVALKISDWVFKMVETIYARRHPQQGK